MLAKVKGALKTKDTYTRAEVVEINEKWGGLVTRILQRLDQARRKTTHQALAAAVLELTLIVGRELREWQKEAHTDG